MVSGDFNDSAKPFIWWSASPFCRVAEDEAVDRNSKVSPRLKWQLPDGLPRHLIYSRHVREAAAFLQAAPGRPAVDAPHSSCIAVPTTGLNVPTALPKSCRIPEPSQQLSLLPVQPLSSISVIGRGEPCFGLGRAVFRAHGSRHCREHVGGRHISRARSKQRRRCLQTAGYVFLFSAAS